MTDQQAVQKAREEEVAEYLVKNGCNCLSGPATAYLAKGIVALLDAVAKPAVFVAENSIAVASGKTIEEAVGKVATARSQFTEPMIKTAHFHNKPIPLTSVLFALAGQENNDGDEGNAMQAAGEFIRSLIGVQADKPRTFQIGAFVKKRGEKGQWHGKVVGTYSTVITPEGYAVESVFEEGSVQIYPVSALELWELADKPAPKYLEAQKGSE